MNYTHCNLHDCIVLQSINHNSIHSLALISIYSSLHIVIEYCIPLGFSQNLCGGLLLIAINPHTNGRTLRCLQKRLDSRAHPAVLLGRL